MSLETDLLLRRRLLIAEDQQRRLLQPFRGRPPQMERRRADSMPTAFVGWENSRPQWQPDESVSVCPVCGTTFSFWYRKHHCRKCGRVVCADCSVYRMSLSQNSVVMPPDLPLVLGDHADESGEVDVRVCQTCDHEHAALPSAPSEPRELVVSRNIARGTASHRHHGSQHAFEPQYGSAPAVSRQTSSRTFHTPELIPAYLRPPAAFRRPPLAEEDECPVCHEALPANDGQGGREAHISECVDAHFHKQMEETSEGPWRRRTVGMVVFQASRQDCTMLNAGQEEVEAECVICFEEFQVGEELGRLECLCKFHRRCIRQWWDTKGPGSCPVHQSTGNRRPREFS